MSNDLDLLFFKPSNSTPVTSALKNVCINFAFPAVFFLIFNL